MGGPPGFETATQTAFEYTSTRSIFTIMSDEKVEIKVTFLSPVTPKDFKTQSLTFSYMNVEVSSLDGKDHQVQIYSDISAEWVSGDSFAEAEWDFGQAADGIYYHKVWKREQHVFGEFNDQAEWGNWYYATSAADGVTYMSGADVDVRGTFDKADKLNNSKDFNYRAINDNWPVFGFVIDLGAVGSRAKSSLFTIGLCQNEAIQFLEAKGIVTLPSLWKGFFADGATALSFFHKDFLISKGLSTELDEQISTDSKAVAGDNYSILTTLAVRQAFGATQLVGTQDKPYLFLKEISSNGNAQTLDVIYPAAPIFLYTNPSFIRLLLDPHFENQEAGYYPNRYAMHDLGARYPNATGHTDGLDEPMPLEECGNNIILVLAYVQHSGDIDYLQAHYPILKQWVDYLISESLYPANQLSTDDFAGHLSNQTNLALKGIIGIEAMAQIARLVGFEADAQNYTKFAHSYIDQWQTLAFNKAAHSPHTTLNYNNASTYSLLYNIFADRLLNLCLVPQSVYDMQSAVNPSLAQVYGVPLDSRNKVNTKTDWEMFVASVADKSTRELIVGKLAKWISETKSCVPWTDLYDVETGDGAEGIDFKARPVVGGVFAGLVLEGRRFSGNTSNAITLSDGKERGEANDGKKGIAVGCALVTLFFVTSLLLY